MSPPRTSVLVHLAQKSCKDCLAVLNHLLLVPTGADWGRGVFPHVGTGRRRRGKNNERGGRDPGTSSGPPTSRARDLRPLRLGSGRRRPGGIKYSFRRLASSTSDVKHPRSRFLAQVGLSHPAASCKICTIRICFYSRTRPLPEGVRRLTLSGFLKQCLVSCDPKMKLQKWQERFCIFPILGCARGAH